MPLCSTAKARYSGSHASHGEFEFAPGGRLSVDREIVILGSSGHARVVADACNSIARPIAGFLGPDAGSRGVIEGVVHLGGDACLEDGDFVQRHDFVVGIGAQQRRAELSRMLCDRGAHLPTVDHDARLADGVHICPGVALAGDVTCGESAFIGTGASVIRGVEIGAGAVVGAGAAVVDDVAAGATVVGVPAREVRSR